MTEVPADPSSGRSICETCGCELPATGPCPRCLLSLAAPGNRDSSSRESDLPFQSIGDYELIELIARGGMGVVYRANQMGLNRHVAVKLILSGQLAARDSLERFRTEASAAALLDHPNIVPVYEVGETDGWCFLSMKLVEGGSLAEPDHEFRLPAELSGTESVRYQRRIAELIARVASAIACSHQHGILHRDLKPSNVLLSRSGEPFVTDFGLAKLTTPQDQQLTRSTAVLGSPSYMAPEQVQPEGGPVSTATDVYGLGTILYELLTGRPPFLSGSLLNTMRSVVEEEPVSTRSVNRHVHPDLETITLKCLAKRPEDRIASASDLADELERFQQGRPVHSRPVSRAVVAARWCRRRPLIAALSGALMVALLMGTTGVLWQWQRAEQTNVSLNASLEQLRWKQISDLLDQGRNGDGLAWVASRLRADPHDWRSQMMARQILRQCRFMIPAGPSVSHGPEYFLHDAVYSPEGSMIATAGTDGTVRVWNRDCELLLTLPHQAVPVKARFSHDGNFLLTVARDNSVSLFDCRDGEQVHSIRTTEPLVDAEPAPDQNLYAVAHGRAVDLYRSSWSEPIRRLNREGKITALKLLQDGHLVVADQSGEVTRYDTSDPERPPVCNYAHDHPVRLLTASPPLNFLATADRTNHLRIWKFDGSEVVMDWRGTSAVRPAFSSDGRYAFVKTGHRSAQVVEPRRHRAISEEVHHDYILDGVAFHPSASVVASTGSDYTARMFAFEPGSIRATTDPMHLPAMGHDLQFDAAGDVLMVRSGSMARGSDEQLDRGVVTTWRAMERPEPEQYLTGGTDAIAVHASGLAAVLKNDHQLLIYHGDLSKPLASLKVDSISRGSMFTEDGTHLILVTAGGTVYRIRTSYGRLDGSTFQVGATVWSADLSPDERNLVTGRQDGTIQIHSLATGQRVREPMHHGSELNIVKYSHDGSQIITASNASDVRIWDARTGKLRLSLPHDYRVQSVRLSPDGQRLVSASNDFTARIWNVASGHPIGAPLQHQSEVGYAEFSPDGRRIVTASRDATARIWDAQTGLPLLPPMKHESALREAMFSPDGRLVITIDHDAVRIWDAATAQPLGPAIPQQSSPGIGFDTPGVRSAFIEGGDKLLTGITTPFLRVIDVELRDDDTFNISPEWLEAIGGAFVDSANTLKQLSYEERHHRLASAE